MKRLEVPAWEFYGWKPETLDFPDGWTVHEQRMKGHSAPKLSAEIRDRIQPPIGRPPLSELARGKRKACIVFDDMTRPTRV